MAIEIREISDADLAALVTLLGKFAEFEHLERYFDVTAERLRQAMFGEDGFVKGLLAMDGDRAVGHALYFPEFASFRGQRGYFVEDLFITDEYRGQGIGERMLRRIAADAAERGFERVDLIVLDWNAPAIAFYERLGAVRDTESRACKFTDDAFRRLAAKNS
jgi:GNAT superfamily N-acetyltransferase